MYKVAFRDALLAWNPAKLKQLKCAMKNMELPDDKFENDYYYRPDEIKKCVDRRVLPPSLLYWRVRAVFVSFGTKIDSSTKKPLFNKTAWGKANNVLHEILEGLISDPPGISFYSFKYGSDGTILKNKYGMELLTCNRGTNDVENIHKHLVTVFGTWNTGIEMSSCLLRERRHRHNHTCSQNHRLGFPTIGHYDTWMVDSLQNLVQRNHSVLLYPHWSNSSDYRQTPESLGTVALHDKTLADAVNSIDLKNPIVYRGDMKFLCDAMGTKIPLRPVITIEERKLFSRFILRTKHFHAEKMAVDWCEHVDGSTIYPKLPVYLRTYHKKWEKNYRIRDAVRKTKSQVSLLHDLNNALLPQVTDGTNDQSVDTEKSGMFPNWALPNHPHPMETPMAVALNMKPFVVTGGMMVSRDTIIPCAPTKKKRGQRGKDTLARRKRSCQRCKNKGDARMYICNGRLGRGYGKSACQFYKHNEIDV